MFDLSSRVENTPGGDLRKRGMLAGLIFFLLVCGCLGEIKQEKAISDPDLPKAEPEKKPNSLLDKENKTQVSNLLAVYMVGSDLESSKGYASADLFEMLKAAPKNQTELEIVIAYGGSDQEGWRGMTIARLSELEKDGQDGIIGNEKLYRKNYKTANMGDQKSLDTFLSYLQENYESERYVLIFWDHGDAYRGVCFDETKNYDRLELSELSASLKNSGLHFELVGFDACLMANLELAKSIAPSADYLLASETIEPTHGWDYVSFIDYYGKNPETSTQALGRKIIDSYLENPQHLRPKTLSLLDLSKTEEVLKNFDSLVEAMDSKLPTPKSYCELGASFTKARKFGVGPKTESEISMDLKSFALQIEKEAPELSEKTKALIESLDAFVLYARRDPEEPEAYGVSLYSPHSGEKTLKTYTQVSLSKTWYGFLENYLERTCADFLEPKISKRGAAFRVEDDSGLATVKQVYLLSPSKTQGLEEKGTSFLLLGSRPLEKNNRGYYTPLPWDGKWIYLRNEKTGEYALLSAIYKGKCEEGKLNFFVSEAELLRAGVSRTCLIHLCLDPKAGAVKAYLNPYEALESGKILFSREVLELEEGDVLFTYAILFEKDTLDSALISKGAISAQKSQSSRNWTKLGKIRVEADTNFVFDYLPQGSYYSALYAEDYRVNFNMTEPEKINIK
ncbi:MAG: clostripain-related cysteine peptidase [Methanosarcinaceae archaeon]|nr:clostripain-related cysteine peptidase [Methanosarcinaceae archaeon]